MQTWGPGIGPLGYSETVHEPSTWQEKMSKRSAGFDKRHWVRPLQRTENLDISARIYQRHLSKILRLTFWPTIYIALGIALIGYIGNTFLVNESGVLKGEPIESIFSGGLSIIIGGLLILCGLTETYCRLVRPINQAILNYNTTNFEVPPADLFKVFKVILLACVRVFGVALSGFFIWMVACLFDRSKGQDLVQLTFGFAVFCGFFGGLASIFLLGKNGLAPVLACLEDLPIEQTFKRSNKLSSYFRGHDSSLDSFISAMFILLLVGIPLYISLDTIAKLLPIGSWLENLGLPPGIGPTLRLLFERIPIFLTLWLLIGYWVAASCVNLVNRLVRLEAYDVRLLVEDFSSSNIRSIPLR